MSLSWKSSAGGSEIRIFDGKQIVGLIKSEFLRSAAYGELYGTMLRFKSKGFRKSTEIFDIEGKKKLGQIKYSMIKRTAEVVIEDQTYQWGYDHWLKKSWYIRDSEGTSNFVKTKFWNNEGEIINEDLPRSAILIGMYINMVFHRFLSAT